MDTDQKIQEEYIKINEELFNELDGLEKIVNHLTVENEDLRKQIKEDKNDCLKLTQLLENLQQSNIKMYNYEKDNFMLKEEIKLTRNKLLETEHNLENCDSKWNQKLGQMIDQFEIEKHAYDVKIKDLEQEIVKTKIEVEQTIKELVENERINARNQEAKHQNEKAMLEETLKKLQQRLNENHSTNIHTYYKEKLNHEKRAHECALNEMRRQLESRECNYSNVARPRMPISRPRYFGN